MKYADNMDLETIKLDTRMRHYRDYADNPNNIYHGEYQRKWNRIITSVIITMIFTLLVFSANNKILAALNFLAVVVIIILIPAMWDILVEIKDFFFDWINGR